MKKAIVFCHFHHPLVERLVKQISSGKKPKLGAVEKKAILASVVPYYKAYLKCKNLGLVYVYVDTGLRQIWDQIFNGLPTINIGISELAFEHTIRNILKLALDQALLELSGEDTGFDQNHAPKFQFVGLPHLASLIALLYSKGPHLVKNLAGSSGFTYDAPKFVEAVIRLARGKDYPILRFDQDVEVNERSIGILLDKIEKTLVIDDHPDADYFFFSGGYGQDSIDNPVDDYAVRCHWLADISIPGTNKPPYHLIPDGMQFLRDIGEFGATSIPNKRGTDPSAVMRTYIKERGTTNRDSQQVISGAGLYMSHNAIRRLPPFMNFEKNIIWVDDHLKRRLHEAIGDLTPGDWEHIDESIFRQDRYPDGIQNNDIEWAKSTYFYRLISGCIMHALIVTRTGEPGKLAEFVSDDLRPSPEITQPTFSELHETFMKIAEDTVKDILAIWENAYYGKDTLLQDWAKENKAEYEKRTGKLYNEWIHPTVEDAIRYCKLVQNWHYYVDAIADLAHHEAYWLYRSIGK